MADETAKDRVMKRIELLNGWGDNPAIVMADLYIKLGIPVDYEWTECTAAYLDAPVSEKEVTLY